MHGYLNVKIYPLLLYTIISEIFRSLVHHQTNSTLIYLF